MDLLLHRSVRTLWPCRFSVGTANCGGKRGPWLGRETSNEWLFADGFEGETYV
jgi:hypothetical protein